MFYHWIIYFFDTFFIINYSMVLAFNFFSYFLSQKHFSDFSIDFLKKSCPASFSNLEPIELFSQVFVLLLIAPLDSLQRAGVQYLPRLLFSLFFPRI
jgi:hypothetical protein